MPELNRRNFLGLGLGAAAVLGLSACSNSEISSKVNKVQAIDAKAFNDLLASAPVSKPADIEANPWAKAIKVKGSLRWGGVDTNALFSIKDIKTGGYLGFDAGIAQLLARFILGESKIEFTGVTSDTRETLLQNNTVDVVVAQYSITPKRKEKIAFAGPYYASGAAVLAKGNSTIKGLNDLAGKKIITQSGSSTIKLLQEKVPTAELVLFSKNEECVQALTQGRGEAYVTDHSVLLGVIRKDPNLKIIGEPLTADPYGIGLNKEKASDSVAFVNAFLEKIEADGIWEKLWKITIGTVVQDSTPKPPTIEK